MNRMYPIIGGLKNSLILFVVLLVGVRCAPAPTLLPSSPQATAISTDIASQPSPAQDPTVTPVPATPTPPQACPTPLAPDGATSSNSSQPTSTEWQDQIVYFLDPHKFCDGDSSTEGGDLVGIRIKMPYLKSLGITTVFLGSVLNPQDFREVDPKLGTNEELVQLIETFHSAGINVVLDLRLSVIGSAHPWFNNPHFLRPWNYQNPKDNLGCAESCEPMMRNGVAVDYDPDKMPVLDHTSADVYPEVRDAIFSLVDNFAIDGITYVNAHHYDSTFWPKFMGDFRARYGETKPDFFHIADVWIWPGAQKSWQILSHGYMNQTSSVGPINMDSIFDWAFITFLQDVFAKGTGNLLQHLVSPWGPEQPERLIAPIDGFSSFRDAVENGNEMEKLYLASAFLMTVNRVPWIDSGNEYGIDYSQPGELFANGLDQTYHENFKKLIQIRRGHAAFRQGNLTDMGTTSNIISYARQYEGETFIVVLNNAAVRQAFTIDLGSRGISCSSVTNLLAENDQTIQLNDASLSVTLDAWEPKIIQCE